MPPSQFAAPLRLEEQVLVPVVVTFVHHGVTVTPPPEAAFVPWVHVGEEYVRLLVWPKTVATCASACVVTAEDETLNGEAVPLFVPVWSSGDVWMSPFT